GMVTGYKGPVEEGLKGLAPARQFGRPAADLVGPMSYCARQTMLDEPNATHGLHRYWRSAFTEEIPDALIDELVKAAGSFSSPLSALLFFYMHGASTRVAPTATAFAPRRTPKRLNPDWAWGGRAESGHETRVVQQQ